MVLAVTADVTTADVPGGMGIVIHVHRS